MFLAILFRHEGFEVSFEGISSFNSSSISSLMDNSTANFIMSDSAQAICDKAFSLLLLS